MWQKETTKKQALYISPSQGTPDQVRGRLEVFWFETTCRASLAVSDHFFFDLLPFFPSAVVAVGSRASLERGTRQGGIVG
mmetsp:Transcript_86091/g.162238  ORF Transcript_86091/g.162238 Transcript_86091/m.162238 type:complete len:80 (+) Transcript_86091:2-241(+)